MTVETEQIIQPIIATPKIYTSVIDHIHDYLSMVDVLSESDLITHLSKSQSLLLQSNISTFTNHSSDSTTELINCVLTCDSPSWLRLLYNHLSALNFCSVVGQKGHHKISILGRYSNVSVTFETIQWLQPHIDRLCQESCVRDFKPFDFGQFGTTRYEALESFRKSFYIDIVGRLYDKLLELQDAELTTNPLACSVAVKLGQETKDYVNKVYPVRIFNGVRI